MIPKDSGRKENWYIRFITLCMSNFNIPDKSKHGIGLKNIKDIVDKYNGQDVIEVNGNVFYHMCILYKVDEK